MTIDLDELQQRVRELPLTRPDPAAVTARVLATSTRVPSPRPARRRAALVALRPIAAVMALVVAVWGLMYFSPAAGAALAGAPGIGPFSSFVLNETGLGAGGAVTSQHSVASSSGVRIELVGAVADPVRTVLLIKVTPASYAFVTPATLVDQFGSAYEGTGGYGDLRTGDWTEMFGPPSFLAARLGMRFTYTVRSIADANGKPVTGSWSVSGTVLSSAGRTIAAPAAATFGGVPVDFSTVTVTDGLIDVTAHVHGLTGAQLGFGTKQTAPGGLTVTVTDFTGKELEAQVSIAPEPGGWAIEILAYSGSDHGTYRLDMSAPNVGTLETTLVT